MFKRYLQISICGHKNPCPAHVNVSRFKLFAIPAIQEFVKIINPNKNIELLAAIESIICHKQEYLVAVADVFDLLLKSPLIEPCALLQWSRLDDPQFYICDNIKHQSTSTTSQSSHRKAAKSKSTSVINDRKEKQQQQQPDSTPITIRDLIIKQLELHGIPLSKKNRNSIS
ncbi:hypothetical protein BLA29_007548 [Euroglyphus maynei]|uniref:Uncharacterized protein n=1 Tax=Euroglyphus maynei TaxID=6958 RepID=A0A1Y3BAT0_EURMA|nr:hypothetical protein BLA29_007548 [Euroglyphus maynei]